MYWVMDLLDICTSQSFAINKNTSFWFRTVYKGLIFALIFKILLLVNDKKIFFFLRKYPLFPHNLVVLLKKLSPSSCYLTGLFLYTFFLNNVK